MSKEPTESDSSKKSPKRQAKIAMKLRAIKKRLKKAENRLDRAVEEIEDCYAVLAVIESHLFPEAHAHGDCCDHDHELEGHCSDVDACSDEKEAHDVTLPIAGGCCGGQSHESCTTDESKPETESSGGVPMSGAPAPAENPLV